MKLINKNIIIIGICIIALLIGAGIIYYNNQYEDFISENALNEIEVQNTQIETSTQNNQINQNELKEKQDEEEKIAIHITGEVKKSGLIYLEKKSRIADAIKMAGGVTKNANLDQVNLAYILEDGQKIYIPNKKEKIEQNEYIISNSGNNVVIENKTSNKKTKGEKTKVNINLANQTELEDLPGIGASLAQRIIDYRSTNGQFKKIEDIQNVKGIGESKYSNIKEYICI